MLAQYADKWAEHVKRGTAQNFKPLRFDQFVSLAKHLEVTIASESSK